STAPRADRKPRRAKTRRALPPAGAPRCSPGSAGPPRPTQAARDYSWGRKAPGRRRWRPPAALAHTRKGCSTLDARLETRRVKRALGVISGRLVRIGADLHAVE